MNSRKKNAALILTGILTLLMHVSFAQVGLEYPTGTGSFRITVPATDPNRNPAQYFSLFLETGDGRYQKLILPDGINTTSRYLPYPYRIEPNAAVLTASGYYDTTPRPPRDAAVMISNSESTIPTAQNMLNGGHIGIDPCVSSIVPGDTMAVALIYKPFLYSVGGNKTMVAFFYNMPYNGGNIFKSIGINTKYKFNGTKVPAIRTFKSERLFDSYDEMSSNTPHTVVNFLDHIKSNGNDYTLYNNALYFEVGTNTTENNIFLSLAPDPDSVNYTTGRSSAFRAVIIRYDSVSGTIFAQRDTTVNLQVSFFARDPNGITTFPHCFKSPADRLISDSVFFQNDGPGEASNVEVTVAIPKGMVFPNDFFVASLKINGIKLPFLNRRLFPNALNTYLLQPGNREIHFRMNKISLAGNIPPIDINKRKAAITFKIRTNYNASTIPNGCSYTTASIVFFNADTGSPNPAIVARDVFRKLCLQNCK